MRCALLSEVCQAYSGEASAYHRQVPPSSLHGGSFCFITQAEVMIGASLLAMDKIY